MSVAVEQAGIDYHVVLAQNALQQCLDQPELQSEFICALVKQTSRHTQHRLGVQVKKAARLVSLGTARVVSPAYCLTKKHSTILYHFFKVRAIPIDHSFIKTRMDLIYTISSLHVLMMISCSFKNNISFKAENGTLNMLSQVLRFIFLLYIYSHIYHKN